MARRETQDIPFESPDIGADEIQAVGCAVRAGLVTPGGPVCGRVEGLLAELTGASFVRLTASLSGAMDLALHGLQVEAGDEVLLPSLASPGLANAILCRGARPVFCDIDAETLTLDVEDVARQLTPRSRLVIAVHDGGVACDLESLLALTRHSGLGLCEDARQGIGAAWNGRHLGTVGDAGWLSFEAGLNVTAGQGAAFLTSAARVAARVSVPGAFGVESGRLEVAGHDEVWPGPVRDEGLGDLLAALLEAQLRRIQELSRLRLHTWQLYHERLADLDESHGGPLRRPRIPNLAAHNAHAYTLQTRTPALRDRLAKELANEGIETRLPGAPLHLSRYAKYVLGPQRALPQTERVVECALRLPTVAGLATSEALRVVNAVRRGVTNASRPCPAKPAFRALR